MSDWAADGRIEVHLFGDRVGDGHALRLERGRQVITQKMRVGVVAVDLAV